MKLKKNYSFLYVPDDDGRSRPLHISGWSISVTLGGIAALLVLATMYIVGLGYGNSWLPGGSELVRENQHLELRIAGLENHVGTLEHELVEVYALQRMVALAVDLEPIDPETFEAGVGGRGPLNYFNDELPGDERPAGGQSDQLSQQLGKLVRQARIQRQGFQAILDTLTTRSMARDHIPSIRPCDTGWLSSRFGLRSDPFTGRQTFHRGIDFSLPVGSAVRVSGDGVVVATQIQRGLGRMIKVDHGNDVVTVYAHLHKVHVKKGQKVQRGDLIAESGNSGRSTAPHLHYEIRLAGRAVNPLSYILDSYAYRN